jgi:TonB family protein
MIYSLTNYLVLSSAVLAVWYLGYRLIFAKNSFHSWNRIYLLAGLGLSVILPLLPSTIETAVTAGFWLSPVIVGLEGGYTSAMKISLADYAYLTVMIILLLKVLLSFWKSITSQTGGSYSFFGRIVVEEGLTPDQESQIFAHEKAHQELGHSFDVLLLEVYKAIHWINPIVWFYTPSLKKVHEFQADQRVAQLGVNLHEYSLLLLSKTLKLQPSVLVNRFHQPSILKQRIIMLNRKSRNTRKYIYLLAIPLMAAAVILSSCSKGAPDSITQTGEVKADKQAEFPGGMEAMFAWMGENLNYPAYLKDQGVEGKVFVKFEVLTDGSLDSFDIKRSLHPDLDKLTIETLAKMPNWSPAMKDGGAIKQEMVLPVLYKID